MTEEIKTYYPNSIEDSSIYPTGNKYSDETSSKDSTGVNNPAYIPPTPISIIPVASNVVSVSLDTQKNQILGSYQFGKVGAIQIGNYSNGVSGDIRISPSGLVGRNSSGTTTFSIDGTTGNATFLGTVAAGSIISASISANQITAGTINASVVTITNLNASNITSGTINASTISITNINASNISTGTLSANRIASGSITATKISVDNLSEITPGLGSITSGTITGVTITSADSDSKIVLNSGNYFEFYSGGTLRGRIRGGYNSGMVADVGSYCTKKDEGFFACVDSNFSDFFKFYANSTGGIIEAPNNNKVYITEASGTTLFSTSTSQTYSKNGFLCDAWGSFGGDLDMNSHLVNEVAQVCFQSRSGRASDSSGIYYYNYGGSYSFRSRMSGSNWQFDQTHI
jgi:hypothetical protein